MEHQQTAATPANPSTLTQTMVDLSGHYALLKDADDDAATLARKIDDCVAKLRETSEAITSTAFADGLVSQATALELSRRLDSLIMLLNDNLLLHHAREMSALDFYVTSIDCVLAARPAHKKLIERDKPIAVDVRQTALGAKALVDDDAAAMTDRLQISLL